MKIKMRTLLAGPRGVHGPGSVIDLDKAAAYDLIERGFAEQVDEPERAVAAKAETATAAPQRKK